MALRLREGGKGGFEGRFASVGGKQVGGIEVPQFSRNLNDFHFTNNVLLSGKESFCNAGDRRCGFNHRVRKIPWRRTWPSTPAFLPEKSHRQKSLEGSSPWGHSEELGMT